MADLLRRYNNKLTTFTNWAAPGDLYHLIFRTNLVAVEGFASPLNVHPDAIIYYSLEERDVVFCANINTFCNQQAWRTPSAINPPFIDHILLQTLEWAIESATKWPETFHYIVVPGARGKWKTHLPLTSHPTCHTICSFPPGTLTFECPHTLTNSQALDSAKWEVLIVLTDSNQALSDPQLLTINRDLEIYCNEHGATYSPPLPTHDRPIGTSSESWKASPTTQQTETLRRAPQPNVTLDTAVPWDCPKHSAELRSCLTTDSDSPTSGLQEAVSVENATRWTSVGTTRPQHWHVQCGMPSLLPRPNAQILHQRH